MYMHAFVCDEECLTPNRDHQIQRGGDQTGPNILSAFCINWDCTCEKGAEPASEA